MVVRTNTMALNAYRQLGMNNNAVAKSLEKLSSGYRINRAADDAAGLAISEKMKAQIKGLETASSNAQDGISLIQTAEGALTEVHNMLNRMVELATKSANGTYSDIERDALQAEVDSLLEEIDRIAESTNYNGLQLLDGSMANKVAVSGAKDLFTEGTLQVKKDGQIGLDAQAGVFSIDLSDLSITASATGTPTFTIFGQELTLNQVSEGGTLTSYDAASQIAEQWNAGAYKLAGVDVTATASGEKVTFTMQAAPTEAWAETATTGEFGLDGIGAGNQAEEVTVTTVKEPVSNTQGRLYAQATLELDDTLVADGKTLTIGDETYVFAVGKNSQLTGMANVIDLTDMEQADLAKTSNLGVAAMRLSNVAASNENFKVGTTTVDGVITLTEREGGVDYDVHNLQGATLTDKTDGDWTGLVKTGTVDTTNSTSGLTLQIGDTGDSFNMMRVAIADMSSEALGLSTLDITTADGARSAINVIKNAINAVSTNRANMGAIQNRLDYTINNLDVAVENLSAANSRIRDTDMAKEMMNYTQMNVLVQSAQAMLAQANQQPQSVLQLLQ